MGTPGPTLMTKMATPDMASSEYFTVGSLVTGVTCLDSEVEGEVLAYDQHAKMLIIKSPSSSNRSTLNNIHMVNLQLVKDVTVKKEMKDTPPTLPSLNIPRVGILLLHQTLYSESRGLNLRNYTI